MTIFLSLKTCKPIQQDPIDLIALRHVLDRKCPNVHALRKAARDSSRNTGNMNRRLRNKRHALDQPTLARLIEEQRQRPEWDDDGGIKSLNRSGWTAALFRLELLSHGYTFVGKGTVKPLIPTLKIEANMYKRIEYHSRQSDPRIPR